MLFIRKIWLEKADCTTIPLNITEKIEIKSRRRLDFLRKHLRNKHRSSNILFEYIEIVKTTKKKIKMKKVYLSKSYQANPELVAEIKTLLKDNGIEFNFYQGGDYNEEKEKLFSDRDGIVVISHPAAFDKDGIVELGKGILSELDYGFELGLTQCVVSKGGKIHKVENIVHYPESQTKNDKQSFQLRMGHAILGEELFANKKALL